MVPIQSELLSKNLPFIGWREWLSLPDLGIPAIKAKIDTGARTSSLHTFSIETFFNKSQRMVRFGIHPLQKRRDIHLYCEAPVVDRRNVKDSGGHIERRYVIQTTAVIGTIHWPVEITLTNRDSMMFRMLLGRMALEKKFLINPAKSYIFGKSISKSYNGKPKGR